MDKGYDMDVFRGFEPQTPEENNEPQTKIDFGLQRQMQIDRPQKDYEPEREMGGNAEIIYIFYDKEEKGIAILPKSVDISSGLFITDRDSINLVSWNSTVNKPGETIFSRIKNGILTSTTIMVSKSRFFEIVMSIISQVRNERITIDLAPELVISNKYLLNNYAYNNHKKLTNALEENGENSNVLPTAKEEFSNYDNKLDFESFSYSGDSSILNRLDDGGSGAPHI